MVGSADPALSQSGASSAATRTNSDGEKLRILAAAISDLGLEWASPKEPPRSQLDDFCQGTSRTPVTSQCPSSLRSTMNSCRVSYSACASATLSSVDGAAEKGYEKLPPLEEAVAAHLCPPTASSWRSRAVHPLKPCRNTSALAERAFSASGQAASALHTVAVLQVFQAKLLQARTLRHSVTCTAPQTKRCSLQRLPPKRLAEAWLTLSYSSTTYG